MSTTPHILLVEDDKDIASLASRYLRANGCRTSAAGDGRDMDRILADQRIDLIVLDVMLPGEDGLSLCRRLRAASTIPIIMLTARADEIDRILGIEMGADDYLGKPFNPRELLARIRAVLRRAEGGTRRNEEAARAFAFRGWRLDVSLRTLTDAGGVRVTLTGAEFDLLRVFCERPARVLSRDQLIDLTQGRASGPFERSIDILVSRLRQKIETDSRAPDLLKTIRAGGYLFTPDVTLEP
jgi:two-component system OmpR family response regulator